MGSSESMLSRLRRNDEVFEVNKNPQFKHKYWRDSQSIYARKTAPVLEFVTQPSADCGPIKIHSNLINLLRSSDHGRLILQPGG
jgi:hypothetical protein